MCTTCHPLVKYQSIKSKDQFEKLVSHASIYQESGKIILANYISDPDYYEYKFDCTECGTKHILWLLPHSLEHGGEWRTIKPSNVVC